MAGRSDRDPATVDPGRVLEITRVFDAPRALVFKVWTDASHLARWWGPKGFTVLSYQADARPGGRFRFGMRSPDGREYWAHGVYQEVAAPAKLVFTTAWEDPNGAPKHETLVTITFADRNGKTEMHFHQALFEDVATRDSHNQGWSETFDLLADYLRAM
jgi:uncharacterized protein YndB with AHSA1/START domain